MTKTPRTSDERVSHSVSHRTSRFMTQPVSSEPSRHSFIPKRPIPGLGDRPTHICVMSHFSILQPSHHPPPTCQPQPKGPFPSRHVCSIGLVERDPMARISQGLCVMTWGYSLAVGTMGRSSRAPFFPCIVRREAGRLCSLLGG